MTAKSDYKRDYKDSIHYSLILSADFWNGLFLRPNDIPETPSLEQEEVRWTREQFYTRLFTDQVYIMREVHETPYIMVKEGASDWHCLLKNTAQLLSIFRLESLKELEFIH